MNMTDNWDRACVCFLRYLFSTLGCAGGVVVSALLYRRTRVQSRARVEFNLRQYSALAVLGRPGFFLLGRISKVKSARERSDREHARNGRSLTVRASTGDEPTGQPSPFLLLCNCYANSPP